MSFSYSYNIHEIFRLFAIYLPLLTINQFLISKTAPNCFSEKLKKYLFYLIKL